MTAEHNWCYLFVTEGATERKKRLKHKGDCMRVSMNSVNMLQKAEASVRVRVTMSAPFPHCPQTV